MKKNILALSLALFLPVTTMSFAQEYDSRDVKEAAADAALVASTHVDAAQHPVLDDHGLDSERVEQESSEQYLARMRSEIIRLYPDYVKEDPEDTMFYQYLEHYQNRQQYVPFLNQAQQSMQKYLSHNQMPKLRALDADESKLDAFLYEDLAKIYAEVERIQQHVNPYLIFNQTILKQVDFHAPLPALSEQDHRRYHNAVDSMYNTYKKQANALALLVNQIDIYNQKINKFRNIASKRIYKAHQDNMNQLNRFSLVLGHFLNAQLKSENAISIASRGYNKYQAEDHPLWAKKFIEYLNSKQNQQRIQPLLAHLPDPKSLYGVDHLAVQLQELSTIQQRCQTNWFDENDAQFVVNDQIDQAKIQRYCQKNQQTLQQVLDNQVQVKALSYQSADIPHLNFLGDFRVYGHDLYYTDSEKNAVYRFNIDTLKEQLIYQHALKVERDGCDHNMCRGVGATDVVLSKNGKIAYVASLDYDQVFAIDLSTQHVIEKYDVERYPRKLLLDESGENLFVYNGVANSISKIQLVSGKIQTQALPASHQGHFCREIDLSFSPISGDIKILGDWPTDPYIYMNSQDMSFYQSDIEVPYDEIYLHDNYQYIVKISERDGDIFAVYDLRLNRLTQHVGMSSEQEEDDSYYRRLEQTHTLHSMGDLGTLGHYFVEQVPEQMTSSDEDEHGRTPYIYLMHLQQGKGVSAVTHSFKLAFQPYKVVAFADQKIMVLAAEDGYSQRTPTGKFAIYDLNSASNQGVLASNGQKLQAQTALTFEDLTQEQEY